VGEFYYSGIDTPTTVVSSTS